MQRKLSLFEWLQQWFDDRVRESVQRVEQMRNWSPVAHEQRVCERCHAGISDTANFCEQCGLQIVPASYLEHPITFTGMMKICQEAGIRPRDGYEIFSRVGKRPTQMLKIEGKYDMRL